jgi:16S rRNA (adenine1518-N6/adenine1519-N6)-dimethyltransferase
VLKGALFYPVPHVDSQGVRLDLRTDIDPRTYPSLLRPLVRHLFSSRRKTVRNNLITFLASRIPPGASAPEIAAETLRSCDIPENERAENLGIGEFAALARVLDKEQAGCEE